MKFTILMLTSLFSLHGEDMGVVRKLAENKFAPLPGLPSCVVTAVESGDPTKGESVIVFKAKAGCAIPWHWHTPTEHVMIVSGAAKVEMKGGNATVLGAGGYAMLPGKHVHQFTCTSACAAFVSSNSAFDIHYVDASGKEIPPETALATKK